MMRTYQTVIMATEELLKRGFEAEFTMQGDGVVKCVKTEKEYMPADMKVIEFHRFEGDSDPADSSIVYAVECNDGQKGIIVSAYGIYGNTQLNNFMKRVKIEDKPHAAGPIEQESPQ